MSPEAEPARGAVDGDVAAELPGLEPWTLVCAGSDGRTPPEIRGRLRDLSSRWSGARAVALRTQPVPHAYRVLFRHLGQDPDETRTPIEQVVMDRLRHGGLQSHGRIADAELLAVLETGVPVVAFDADLVQGEIALRPAADGERLGEGELAGDLSPGRLVLADERGPLAVLFGRAAANRLPTRATTRVHLCAVRAPGVPELHVEEALWTAAEVLF